MSHLSTDYRLSLYSKLVELSKDKIYIVRNSLDDKFYVKKILYPENYKIYEKLKELSSPNIPKIYETLELEDRLIVIEEYINGDSLEEILKKHKSLKEDIVIDYAIELCNVLDILHNCQPPIIHRDIKPSNIIISNDNVLKLIDFDVSRMHKKSTSSDTEILGTYGYAAPEQYGFSQSDPRTDIYSLGVTLNILLTGKFPVDELYDGNLSNIIAKCTRLDPNSRYQNVRELRHELMDKSKSYKNNNKQITEDKLHKLPGFRTSNKLIRLLGYLWYGFLLLIAMGVFTEDLTAENRFSDILLVIFFLSLTLLLGNYKNIKSKLPLLSSKKFIVRLIGYGLYLFSIFLIIGLLLPE